MAWTNDDWFKSGITDTYRLVMCDNRTLKEIADLSGFVDGRLSCAYEGDLKYSGTVNVSNSNFVTGRLLRLYHTATLESEGKSITRCLGTFFTGNDEQQYIHGRYSGTIELYSMLKRFTDSKLTRPFTFGKDKSALGSYWALLQLEGAKNYGKRTVKDKKWKNAETVDFGESLLNALNRVAEFLDGQIGVDAQGYITLSPYVAPKDKPVSYTVKSGTESVVFEGVDVTVDRTDVVNRFSVKYEKSSGKNKVTIYGTYSLGKDNTYSFEKRGRHVDETETLQNMSPETKQQAEKVAKNRLSKLAGGTVTYVFNSYALPIDIGQVIRFMYKDSESHAGIDVKGMVTNVEYTLGLTGMRMQTTIRKVG